MTDSTLTIFTIIVKYISQHIVHYQDKNDSEPTSIEVSGGPGGGKVKYTGSNLFCDLCKVGFGVVCVIGGYFIFKKLDKKASSSNKICEEDNKTSNHIKEHHEASKDSMSEDDNRTDNKIKLLEAESRIRIEERKRNLEITKEQRSVISAPASKVKPETLSQWIDVFHKHFNMPATDSFVILNDIISGCPEGYEDAMLLNFLSEMGSLCFSKVRAIYLDSKYHAPNILNIIEGKKGAGKGKFQEVYEALFGRIIKSDQEKITQDSDKLIIQTAGIRITASKFTEVLAFNHGVHMYAFEPEIIALYEAFKKEGGLSPDHLRKAFDNGTVYQNSKASKKVKGHFPVCFNYTLTGTPDAVNKLFCNKEVEGGTARRHCFTVIPEPGRFAPCLDLPVGDELERMRDQIDEWRSKYCYTTNANVDSACKIYEIGLDYVCNKLNDWLCEQYDLSVKCNDSERNEVRMSIAAIAFHCAIVLHMLAGEPTSSDRKKRKAVVDMTIYIANLCMERYLTKFDKEYVPPYTTEESSDKVVPSILPIKRNLTLEELEEWYDKRGTYDDEGNKIGYGRIAKNLGVDEDRVKNSFRWYKKNVRKE